MNRVPLEETLYSTDAFASEESSDLLDELHCDEDMPEELPEEQQIKIMDDPESAAEIIAIRKRPRAADEDEESINGASKRNFARKSTTGEIFCLGSFVSLF